MAQKAIGIIAGAVEELILPNPSDMLMAGVKWGEFDNFFTPAFWAVQAWLDRKENRYGSYKLGNTLEEEVTACLLGGHGIPSEVGLAAFKTIRDKGLITRDVTLEEITSALQEPLEIGARPVRYRFWRQKSKYLHQSIVTLFEKQPVFCRGKELRDWMVANLSGVGPKTASWIARNWLSSDEVAIIDIHIQRAGVYAGFFTEDLCVEKNYYEMEDRFLQFANALGVRPAILDTLIWRQMKDLNYNSKTAVTRKPTSLTPYQPSFDLFQSHARAVAV